MNRLDLDRFGHLVRLGHLVLTEPSIYTPVLEVARASQNKFDCFSLFGWPTMADHD